MIVVDSLTTGELMSLLAYCMNILMSLMMLSMVFVMISMSMASMRRIAAVRKAQDRIRRRALAKQVYVTNVHGAGRN